MTEIPSVRHKPVVVARRRASSGLRVPGRIAASPLLEAPRIRLSSTVSAWSSAVWPVMTSSGSTA
jgi:hypothetical protein